MTHYRPFRNDDPARLVNLWNSRTEQRGLARPLSIATFEELVLGKPYFDRQGLIVALDDDSDKMLRGFAHTGFGPKDSFDCLDKQLGAICLLMTDDRDDAGLIAGELVERSEAYLRNSGTRVIYGGGMFPVNPFYLGLYGGSELPGILRSDKQFTRAVQSAGYREADCCKVLHLDVARFRPTVNRRQIQIRRTTQLETVFDTKARHWWDACTSTRAEELRFDLQVPGRETPGATVSYWNMDLFSGPQSPRVFGLTELEVDQHLRRQGLATFLVSESIKQLSSMGVTTIEVQTMVRNQPALGLYAKLGFEEIDEGVVYRKDGVGSI